MILHAANNGLRIWAISRSPGQWFLCICTLTWVFVVLNRLPTRFLVALLTLFVSLLEDALVVLYLLLQVLLEGTHAILHMHLSYDGLWWIIGLQHRSWCDYGVCGDVILGVWDSSARILPLHVLLRHVMILVIHLIAWWPARAGVLFVDATWCSDESGWFCCLGRLMVLGEAQVMLRWRRDIMKVKERN